jgi:hypothetical protein
MSRFWSRSALARDDWPLEHDDRDTTLPGMGWGADDSDLDGDEDDLDPSTFAHQARMMAEISGQPIDAAFDQALQHVESGADPEDVFGEMDLKSAEHEGRDE